MRKLNLKHGKVTFRSTFKIIELLIRVHAERGNVLASDFQSGLTNYVTKCDSFNDNYKKECMRTYRETALSPSCLATIRRRAHDK